MNSWTCIGYKSLLIIIPSLATLPVEVLLKAQRYRQLVSSVHLPLSLCFLSLAHLPMEEMPKLIATSTYHLIICMTYPNGHTLFVPTVV